MKNKFLLFFTLFFICGVCSAQEEKKIFVIDDFEGEIISGPAGTIDIDAGGGSSVEVSADNTEKKSGQQSLKIVYDAVSGGYIRVARGYDLDVKGAARWLIEPEKINWDSYAAISFAMLGTGSGAKIAFDIKDANSQIFRFMVIDDSQTWKTVVCPFDQFSAIGQPQNAGTDVTLVFPIKSFQFEPVAISKDMINVDEVALEPLN
ncbi:MAG TPA: carbohydrate binding domain-containing protein [Candidatus Omnitrophota bacterium]|nr:carbohydrate binding domain-containing protein [Candidatus Omnitrophota bacterium]